MSELEAILCEEHEELCSAFDRSLLQESWSWRNVHTARELAKHLVTDDGELDISLVRAALHHLETKGYSLLEERHHDAPRLVHLKKMLRLFLESGEVVEALHRFKSPDHRGALHLIRETLELSSVTPVTDTHTKQAVLAALFTLLRQNVGSCFATAPAILVQQEQPLQFFADLEQMLSTGRLTRVIEGVEFAVPLTIHWGMGELLRPIRLLQLEGDPVEALSVSPGLQAALHTDQKGCKEKVDSLKIVNSDPFSVVNGYVLIRALAEDVQSACAVFKRLTDNALLKGWEFTLASMAEVKADVAKWNLYTSLGLSPDEAGGVGQYLHAYLEEKLRQINEEIEVLGTKYDHLFAAAKSLEGRFSRADTARDAEWIRADYKVRRQELNQVVALRDELHEKGRRLSSLMPDLATFYGEKIRDYFQEVYDAQMHDVSSNPFDDSPAGFRLLYKHGRTNTAMWTLVYTPEEYLEVLAAFFTATEIDLLHDSRFEGLDKELSQLVTTILTAIKEPDFLQTSCDRLARAYREPLTDPPKRAPWAYISGGTMGTLVSCYFEKTTLPEEEKQWFEAPLELLTFTIDTCKNLPRPVQQLYDENPDHSMLAFSPTHAFLGKPGWRKLKQAWQNDQFTYTWVRDHWINPQHRFLDDNILNSRMIERLVDELLLSLPAPYRPIARQALRSLPPSLRSNEFRDHVTSALSYEKWLKGGLPLIADELDALLYRSLPLVTEKHIDTHVHTILQALDIKRRKTLKPGRYHLFTATQLRQFALQILIEELGTTRVPEPYDQKIVQVMQDEGFAYPAPFLTADTNWVKNVFGFTLNPGTSEIDFWRFDHDGRTGRPISPWRPYLNGQDKHQWGFYTEDLYIKQF